MFPSLTENPEPTAQSCGTECWRRGLRPKGCWHTRSARLVSDKCATILDWRSLICMMTTTGSFWAAELCASFGPYECLRWCWPRLVGRHASPGDGSPLCWAFELGTSLGGPTCLTWLWVSWDRPQTRRVSQLELTSLGGPTCLALRGPSSWASGTCLSLG